MKNISSPVSIAEHDWPPGTLPRVTIKCITYNHSNYIRDAIEGFLMQETTFPVEILIHDDASTDGTAEIVAEYQTKYPNLIHAILQTENQTSKGSPGKQYARECMAKHMRGTYIALCDGDDYWLDSTKLQRQVEFLECNGEYSASFHETFVESEGIRLSRVYGQTAKTELVAEDTISKLAPFHTSSFLVRKAAWPDLENLPSVVSEDMRLFSMVAGYGPIWKAPGVCSVYRKHSGGMTNTSRVIENFHTDRVELINWLNDHHDRRFERKARRIAAHHQAEFRRMREQRLKQFIAPSLSPGNSDRYLVRRSIIEALLSQRDRLHGTVLDVGCGQQPYKDIFLSPPSRVTRYIGLDLADNPVHENQPDITWQDGKIPLEEASVDCAICTEVLEHCPDPEAVLREVCRVLKPGGLLFFTVPFLWPLHEVPYDQYRYTPYALERHLANSGFEEVDIRAMGGWDASLAQMLGLWVRRRPMQRWLRAGLSTLAWPLVWALLKVDARRPVAFRESVMITGLSGTARKPAVQPPQAEIPVADGTD